MISVLDVTSYQADRFPAVWEVRVELAEAVQPQVVLQQAVVAVQLAVELVRVLYERALFGFPEVLHRRLPLF